MKRVKITGYLEYEGSKIGERHAEIQVEAPYSHTAKITITGNKESDSDNVINDAMEPFWSNKVKIDCDVDEYGSIYATPARIELVT